MRWPSGGKTRNRFTHARTYCVCDRNSVCRSPPLPRADASQPPRSGAEAQSPFQVGRRHRFQWHPIGPRTVALAVGSEARRRTAYSIRSRKTCRDTFLEFVTVVTIACRTSVTRLRTCVNHAIILRPWHSANFRRTPRGRSCDRTRRHPSIEPTDEDQLLLWQVCPCAVTS